MNKEFERAFPEKSIFEYVDYDTECNMYGSKEHISGQELIGLFVAISNLNGAWWAWSYQQNKIDAIKAKLSNIYDACDEDGVCMVLDEIKELLK